MCGYEITNFIRKDFIQYSALSIKREERFMGLSIQITDTVHVCFRKGKYITQYIHKTERYRQAFMMCFLTVYIPILPQKKEAMLTC